MSGSWEDTIDDFGLFTVSKVNILCGTDIISATNLTNGFSGRMCGQYNKQFEGPSILLTD